MQSDASRTLTADAALRARVADLERELAATRAERDFLYASLEHVPVGLEMYDQDGVALWLNRAMLEFTGLPSAEVAVGRFNILTDPFSVATGMVDYYRRAYAGEVVHTREFAIDLELAAIDWGASSKLIRFRMVLCPQRDADGRVLRVLAVMFEVTQHHVARRVAERLLATHDDDEASRLIVEELTREHDILHARVWRDPGAEGGALAQHAQRLRATEENPPTTHGVADDFARRARDTAQTQTWMGAEERAPTSEPTHPTLHARVAAPIQAPQGVVGVIEVGTSSRYLATQALPAMVERIAELYAEFYTRTRAQQRFERLFQRSPDPTLVIDAAGVVHAANERARALFGETPASLDAVFEGFTALDPRHLAAFDEGRDAHRPVVWLAQNVVLPDGASVPAEIGVSLLDADAHEGARRAVLAVRDLRERAAFEAELRRSLAEKETLLREVHHRVKNNLQIVSSLVNMQADRLADPGARAALLDCADRVRAMSLVHQVLYGGEHLGSVPLADYARSLAEHLRDSLAPHCAMTFDLAEVQVSLEDAVPCGLILNELITNAIKHGRNAEGASAIDVAVTTHADGYTLCVEDDGPGFALPVPRGSLGVQLIQALSRQLGGKFATTPRNDAQRAAARVVVQRRPASAPPASH
jgi:PAS domain S-box-containing protein